MKISKRLIGVTGMRDIAQRQIPVLNADSGIPGPVVWLTACIHGDEVGGVAVVHDVVAAVRKSGLRCGSVRAVPLVNSMGFETVSRFFNSDREDLNRCFPGRADGTMGQQVARRLFDTMSKSAPSLVIDIHNDWVRSIPYILIEAARSDRYADADRAALRLARAAGLLLVADPDTYQPTHNTLSGALMAAGVPAFTIEAGGAYSVVEEGVACATDAVLRVLRCLGMLAPNEPPDGTAETRMPCAYTNQPLCTKNGLLRFAVQPGERVATGQALAHVYSAFGSLEETLRATAPGLVLGLEDHARALPGREFIAIAQGV
ncbi:MAG: succinylglutamate desuccinylase/aspartoacylase family protein [Gammaproteobacteria bacterium]|jgi:predicted deacylase